MVTSAIEFESIIDTDGKISIPVEYREHLPSKSRVILLPENDGGAADLIKVSESTLDFWNNEDDKVWDNV